MAASGTVKTAIDPATGLGLITITNNGGSILIGNGSDISYSKPGFTINVNDNVSFTIANTADGVRATNIQLVVPAGPPDEGTVQTGTISGNLTVGSGQIITLKGATVTGNVQVRDGGKLIIKPNDSGMQTIIDKGLMANTNSIVVLYNSEIQGTVSVTNCQSFTSTGGKIDSSLVLINDASVVADGTTIDGDVVGNNNTSITVKNCTITGNLDLHSNTSCSQNANTVAGSNSGCV